MYGPLGPLGGTKPVGFTPDGVAEKIVAEAIRVNNTQPGTDHDWEDPFKLAKPGVNGSTVPVPYKLDPARVPVAGSYSGASQQESLLTSAWYRITAQGRRCPTVSITAAGPSPATACSTPTDGQTVELGTAVPDPAGAPAPGRAGGALRHRAGPVDATCAPRPLADPRRRDRGSHCGPGQVAVARRLGGGHPAPGTGAAFGAGVRRFDPAGSDGLGGRAGLPLQQPMLHVNGVTQVPKFRITPDYRQEAGHRHLGGRPQRRPAEISDLLLRANVMATYLSDDWGRDWGSLRKFDTIVDAQPARSILVPPPAVDCGSPARSGSRPDRR